MPPATRASAGRSAARVAEILRRTPQLMRALRIAREVGPPDWFIAAGAIRDAVWDNLHELDLSRSPRDVAVIYFDPADLGQRAERAVELQLESRAPDLPWDVKNQAAVHLWYPRVFGVEVGPFASSEEAIATFPEVATSVGVRLLDDDDMLVVAPHGLDDLLEGVCRHNPTRVSAAFYRRRIDSKRWRARWPRVRFLL